MGLITELEKEQRNKLWQCWLQYVLHLLVFNKGSKDHSKWNLFQYIWRRLINRYLCLFAGIYLEVLTWMYCTELLFTLYVQLIYSTQTTQLLHTIHMRCLSFHSDQKGREYFFLQHSTEKLKASWDYSSHHSGWIKLFPKSELTGLPRLALATCESVHFCE